MALPCLVSSEVVLAAVQENSQILNSVDEAGGSGGIGGGGGLLERTHLSHVLSTCRAFGVTGTSSSLLFSGMVLPWHMQLGSM